MVPKLGNVWDVSTMSGYKTCLNCFKELNLNGRKFPFNSCDQIMKIFQTTLLLTFSLMLFAAQGNAQVRSTEAQLAQVDTSDAFKIIAYYTGDKNQIDAFNVQQLDQIIVSFLHLSGNRLQVPNEIQDETIQKLVGLKKDNPQLKILISLGGWGGCETCSEVFSTERNCKAFSKSVLKMLKIYRADGIDLDWEYPAIEGFPNHAFKPEDKQNFTTLVKTLRSTLGEEYTISFAAGAHRDFLSKSIEWKKVMPLVDNVNLMTYDLVNGYSKITGHHTSLNKTNEQPLSTEYAVDYLDSLGIPMNKIVIGAAFYGRIWSGVDTTNNGLYQKGTYKTSANYKEFAGLFHNGFKQHWDSIAEAPYAYNIKKREFMTYDNKRSVQLKTKYVKSKGLKGIMFWELMHDTKNGLLQTIHEGQKKR